MEEIKIIIASHKKYQKPAENIYLPVQVGAEGKEKIDGYTQDNTGENISIKNPNYCELTGLYWAWKNLNAKYIGLVHYRRYFTESKKIPKEEDEKFKVVLTEKQIKEKLKNVDIILPKKRKYYIETLYSHYEHTHYASQLDITREIIAEKYPDYLKSYDEVVKHTYGYMFNMMIMQKRYLNDYCEWLFDILFELEKRIDPQELSAFQGRFYGRVSEIIFNVWLDAEIKLGKIKKNEIKELP